MTSGTGSATQWLTMDSSSKWSRMESLCMGAVHRQGSFWTRRHQFHWAMLVPPITLKGIEERDA